MSHGTHINESYHADTWVILCIWWSHVRIGKRLVVLPCTPINESYCAYGQVMWRIRKSEVWLLATPINRSFCANEWVMSRVRMSQIDRKKPPPPGGAFYLLCSLIKRAVCTRFHDEMQPSHLVVKSLTHGSWSENILNRKPPPGGGVLSIKVVHIDEPGHE